MPRERRLGQPEPFRGLGKAQRLATATKYFRLRWSDAATATHEVQDEYDQSDHEQDVNETARNMESKPAAPQNQKNNGDN